jgi:poly(hydroxyalkanoate) granule-associated protein
MSASTRLSGIPTDVLEAAQRVWLAGLGAMVLAQEEGNKLAGGTTRLFTQLVEKGEEMQKDLPSPIARVKDAAGTAEDAWTKLQSMLDSQVAAALHRLGVPTKDEIARLTARIEQLTASVEALRAQQG